MAWQAGVCWRLRWPAAVNRRSLHCCIARRQALARRRLAASWQRRLALRHGRRRGGGGGGGRRSLGGGVGWRQADRRPAHGSVAGIRSGPVAWASRAGAISRRFGGAGVGAGAGVWQAASSARRHYRPASASRPAPGRSASLLVIASSLSVTGCRHCRWRRRRRYAAAASRSLGVIVIAVVTGGHHTVMSSSVRGAHHVNRASAGVDADVIPEAIIWQPASGVSVWRLSEFIPLLTGHRSSSPVIVTAFGIRRLSCPGLVRSALGLLSGRRRLSAHRTAVLLGRWVVGCWLLLLLLLPVAVVVNSCYVVIRAHGLPAPRSRRSQHRRAQPHASFWCMLSIVKYPRPTLRPSTCVPPDLAIQA
jgi:hypothetical protein